eukprot:5445644-Pleurochrysis_carterae.AAC.1
MRRSSPAAALAAVAGAGRGRGGSAVHSRGVCAELRATQGGRWRVACRGEESALSAASGEKVSLDRVDGNAFSAVGPARILRHAKACVDCQALR